MKVACFVMCMYVPRSMIYRTIKLNVFECLLTRQNTIYYRINLKMGLTKKPGIELFSYATIPSALIFTGAAENLLGDRTGRWE